MCNQYKPNPALAYLPHLVTRWIDFEGVICRIVGHVRGCCIKAGRSDCEALMTGGMMLQLLEMPHL